MHVMTTTPPDPQEPPEAANPEPEPEPPVAWRWALDQQSSRTPDRTDSTTALALVAHHRPLLEPIGRIRQVPSVQLDAAPRRPPERLHHDTDSDEAGQATAEYALVLLGAAAIALLVVSWATKTNVVGKLLDVIFSQLIGRATGGH